MIKHLTIVLAAALMLFGCGSTGGGFIVTKPLLKLVVSASKKNAKYNTFADSCEKRIAVPYVKEGDPAQVLDIYYAPAENRKNAVLIDVHGGFYVAGSRESNRPFASAFLKEGYDVVLLEYRLNDGKRSVSDELGDCAAALDYLATNSEELGLNKGSMFLTGDSAGGHLVLYMAEGTGDSSVPVRPKMFAPRGVLVNCPAYDFASFSNPKVFSKGALEWFIGPKYADREWLESMSPRTFVASYKGPLFISTCTNDFIREQALMLKAERDSLGCPAVLLDIESDDKKVAHVHNVISPGLPESQNVNSAMVDFMNGLL
ncbi:MAG: alpha/beta hydrolase [Bacteroidales bacterium]|nr:alpha/beta hydrolase [Bacteroidales bacterium]